MPNVESLEQYLRGVEAYKEGREEDALKLIAQSVGADEPTSMMRDSLKELTDLNIAMLALILNRSRQ